MAEAGIKFAFCGLALCAFSLAASAQRAPRSTSQLSNEPAAQLVEVRSPRLVNVDEGMAIIGAALEARHSLHPYGDCSHLVHTIYEQAGFHYRYADSTDLYEGVPEFRRVTRPQPGDLAVWRGHAAIVVNPAQHTFFSATRSGMRVESYDLAYWKRRGTPRFFRYAQSGPPTSLAVTRTANSQPANLRRLESRTPLNTQDDAEDATTDDPPSDQRVTVNKPAPLLLVHTPQPQPMQVNEAVSQYFGESERSLQSQDPLRLTQPFTAFDHIEVKDVRLKGNQGWATVKIDGLCALAAGRMTKKRSGQQRWVLIRRDANTWELLPPANTTYLPHDVAVRILAHQLANLTDHASETGDSSKDQAQLARALNSLLEK